MPLDVTPEGVEQEDLDEEDELLQSVHDSQVQESYKKQKSLVEPDVDEHFKSLKENQPTPQSTPSSLKKEEQFKSLRDQYQNEKQPTPQESERKKTPSIHVTEEEKSRHSEQKFTRTKP